MRNREPKIVTNSTTTLLIKARVNFVCLANVLNQLRNKSNFPS